MTKKDDAALKLGNDLIAAYNKNSKSIAPSSVIMGISILIGEITKEKLERKD